MSLAVVSSAHMSKVPAELDELQFQQFEHDEAYHREITRLPLQQRLRHMTLHFAKYSGNLVEAQGREDAAAIQRIVIDVFIIGMSTANALNFKLSEHMPRQLTEAGQTEGLPSFAATLAICAGKMAAACEKLDHLEDFPFRPTLRGGTIALVAAASALADANGWDLQRLVRARLEMAKAKLIHRDRLEG